MYKIIIIYVGYKKINILLLKHIYVFKMYRYFDVFEGILGIKSYISLHSFFSVYDQQPHWFQFRFRLNSQEKRNFQNSGTNIYMAGETEIGYLLSTKGSLSDSLLAHEHFSMYYRIHSNR